MAEPVPRIVQRFPCYRDRLLRARWRDSDLGELIEDYDTLAEALETEEAHRKSGQGSEQAYKDLVGLCRELENDILRRLATQ